jgi:hypothetical protein
MRSELLCPHCQLPLRIIAVSGADADRADRADVGDLGELLLQIHDENLEDGWEIKFIRETRERFAEWGGKIRMSEKQMGIVRRIANR